MLVLSRKIGESIVIDGGIVITVNKVMGQRVSLGITAPSKVHIVRGELVEQSPSDESEECIDGANRRLAACH